MAAMLGLALGCSDALYFDCSDDGQCDLGGAPGVCFAGECAYPDGDCDSGYAYPSQARPPFAGQCVDEAGTLGGTGSTGSTGDSADSIDSVDTGDSSADGTESGGPQVEPRCHVVQLDGGEWHTCARTEAGAVWCWGRNDEFRLGVEGPGSRTPVEVTSIENPVDHISTENDHTCALADGQVWCWGEQAADEIVLGSSTGGYLPTRYPLLQGIVGFTSANAVNCAHAGDEVLCWGEDNAGVNDPDQLLNTRLTGVGDSLLGNGAHHVCAQTDRLGSDTVECWGNNASGQLGDPGTLEETMSAPTIVQDLDGFVDAFGLGEAHSCALIEGQTWCWGADEEQQLLGTGSGPEVRLLDTVPIAEQMAAGRGFTCVLSSEGDASCWGQNSRGQSDPQAPGTTSGLNSVAADITQVTGVEVTFEVMGLGQHHGCGASPQGGIWCWGDFDGQFDGSPENGFWLGEQLDDNAHIGRVTLPNCP